MVVLTRVRRAKTFIEFKIELKFGESDYEIETRKHKLNYNLIVYELKNKDKTYFETIKNKLFHEIQHSSNNERKKQKQN